MVSPAQAPVKTLWTDLGVEPPEWTPCAYCGRLIPRATAHRESRHVGGQDDRDCYYCPDGRHRHQPGPASGVALVVQVACQRGLAVGLTFDPDALPSESWVCTIGLDASGAGSYPSAALGAALLDLDGVPA